MVLKRLSVSGSLVGSPEDMVDVLQFAQQAGVRCMVETFPLDKAQEAYDHVGKARFRAVLIP
jgi:D-arabinose 1-dehydrogenase-like Zn-dependent alcohol dehydrogenase